MTTIHTTGPAEGIPLTVVYGDPAEWSGICECKHTRASHNKFTPYICDNYDCPCRRFKEDITARDSAIEVYDPAIIRQLEEQDKLRRIVQQRNRVAWQQSSQTTYHIAATLVSGSGLGMTLLLGSLGALTGRAQLLEGAGVMALAAILSGVAAIISGKGIKPGDRL